MSHLKYQGEVKWAIILTTNEFVYLLPDDLGSSCWCCFCIDLVPTKSRNLSSHYLFNNSIIFQIKWLSKNGPFGTQTFFNHLNTKTIWVFLRTEMAFYQSIENIKVRSVRLRMSHFTNNCNKKSEHRENKHNFGPLNFFAFRGSSFGVRT